MVEEKDNRKSEYKDIIDRLCAFFDLDYSKIDDRIIINAFLVPFKCNAREDMLEIISSLDHIVYGGKRLTVRVVPPQQPNFYNRRDNAIELNKYLLSFGSDCVSSTLYHELGHAIFDNFYSRCDMGNAFYLLSGAERLNPYDLKALRFGESRVEKSDGYLNLLGYLDVENKKIERNIENESRDFVSFESLSELEKRLSTETSRMGLLKALKNDSKNSKLLARMIKEEEASKKYSELHQDKEAMLRLLLFREKIAFQSRCRSKYTLDYRKFGDIARMYSMLTSLKLGNENYDSGNREYSYPYGHSKDYYLRSSSPEYLAYNELFADYFALLMHNRVEAISLIKSAMGEQLFDNLSSKVDTLTSKMKEKNL